MISAVFDHLWQSTLLALGIGALALVFRRARADVRYGLWLVASLKFLVPFAALSAIGERLPAVHPPADMAPQAILVAEAAQPFSRTFASGPAVHAAHGFDPASMLLGVWAAGCAVVLIVRAARWMKVRAALREATPLTLPAPMPALASPWMREPGLVGFWRPVLLIPDTLLDRLSPPEIGALVEHEASHLRRRDNLTAALHMLVEALFWFHPLVWWIGGRLIAERERACDEAVVLAGHDRESYARSLIECCRHYLQSPLPCVAGASGSDLLQRVETIMTAQIRSPLSRSTKALLAASGVCALATPVMAGWLASPQGRGTVVRVAAVHAHDQPARAPTPTSRAPAPTPAEEDAAPIVPVREDRPSPPAVVDTVSPLSLAPAPRPEVTKASLTPVSAQMSEGGPALGPGHYVERSGLKSSGGCSVGSNADGFRISTRPIAPGHVITNFRYELVGDNRCKPKWQSARVSAMCEVLTDRPDRKTVQFQLLPNGDNCFGYTAFAQEGSHHDNEASGTITQDGAVTRSEMVISYDVQ